jgi:hypothetical protein
MLSPELETRISQIIEKLNKLSLKENNSNDKITPLESEKYEYRIQKNAQKRMSQITTKVTDFFFEDEDGKKINPEQKSENTESSKISPSIALNMKRLIKIGEFQIELEKLLEILEFSLNEESADKKNELMEKYINDITFVSDENSMNDEIKMKKFGESLEKKYHKIAQLLKGYIKENLIVNNIMEKEKKNKIIKKGKRRSLFDNIPLINEKENKVLKDFPNFGNTFLSEMKEDIKKNKRYSCVNIDKTNIVKNISDEENSESDNEDVNEDNNNNKVYRPGKLRSSLCFDNLFIC